MFSISPENSVFKEKITFTKESEFFLMDKVHRSEFCRFSHKLKKLFALNEKN